MSMFGNIFNRGESELERLAREVRDLKEQIPLYEQAVSRSEGSYRRALDEARKIQEKTKGLLPGVEEDEIQRADDLLKQAAEDRRYADEVQSERSTLLEEQRQNERGRKWLSRK